MLFDLAAGAVEAERAAGPAELMSGSVLLATITVVSTDVERSSAESWPVPVPLSGVVSLRFFLAFFLVFFISGYMMYAHKSSRFIL